jgi:hypothetical protein
MTFLGATSASSYPVDIRKLRSRRAALALVHQFVAYLKPSVLKEAGRMDLGLRPSGRKGLFKVQALCKQEATIKSIALGETTKELARST